MLTWKLRHSRPFRYATVPNKGGSSNCGRVEAKTFVWRSPKRRCYGNQLTWELSADVGMNDLYSSLCSGVRQWIQLSWSRFQKIKWQSVYTVYKFGELLSNNLEAYAVKTRNFCRDSVAIWQSTWIRHTGIPKRIGISKFWFHIGDWRSPLYIL